ncbi:DUF6889 family protein [Chitinasiproducens palmae]|uniref:Uncharacterized protein n=1 Tax=Chitinasiproducens palmae TaxID=1770053 RepID=A0A1H2PQJ2_9BURK|nr:hypothetical protein [Chitinasiproducens palmae]SDV49079.1 hypothetical protein SAMN05216551_10748 [Chitinasiproducens palmae]
MLPDGEDWLLAPVIAGMCRYESLLDGSIGLEDIALMNDALAVRADNELRARRLMEEKNV